MADKSINQLPVSDGLTDDGLLVVYQNSETKSIRGNLIKQFAQQGIEAAMAEAKASGEFDGADGQDGKDGYTPVKGVDYFDGKDGQDGKDGADGSDGVSCTHSWSGTTLTITSASGTSSADLKGEKGDTGGTGATGADGYTPVRGVDYWTDADKTEIVDEVTAEIGTSAGGGVADVQIDNASIVDENGVAQIPVITAAAGGVGLFRVGNVSNGLIGVKNNNGKYVLVYPEASANGFTNRKTQGSQYSGVVSSKNFDLAVKTAMTDGVGAAWTEAEQAAARARIGVTAEGGLVHSHTADVITGGTFGGEVSANSEGQTTGNSVLRNSKLVSVDTAPSVNGEIYWTYG